MNNNTANNSAARAARARARREASPARQQAGTNPAPEGGTAGRRGAPRQPNAAPTPRPAEPAGTRGPPTPSSPNTPAGLAALRHVTVGESLNQTKPHEMVLAADSALNQLFSRYPELRTTGGGTSWPALLFAKGTHELARIVRMSYGMTQAPGILYVALQKLLTPTGRFRQLEVATPGATFEPYTLQTLMDFTTQTLFPPKLLETTARQAMEQPYEGATKMPVRVVLDELRTLAMLVPNRAPKMAQDLMRIFEANKLVFKDPAQYRLLSVELMHADERMEAIATEVTADISFQWLNQILVEWSTTTNFSGAQSPDTTIVAFTTRRPVDGMGGVMFPTSVTDPATGGGSWGNGTPTAATWPASRPAEWNAAQATSTPLQPILKTPPTVPSAAPKPGEQERLLQLVLDRVQSLEKELQQNKRSNAVLAVGHNSEEEGRSDSEGEPPAKRTRFTIPPRKQDLHSAGLPPRPCTFCGDNHWHSECTVRNRQYGDRSPRRGDRSSGGRSPRSQPTRFPRECYLCRAPDHFARECPLRYSLETPGNRAPPATPPTQPTNTPINKPQEEVMVMIMGKDGNTISVPKAALEMFQHQASIQKVMGQ